MQRKIIHIDCDCFYASVEMRDNPALRDVPLAIGGAADQRGVVATCNYPARKFGIHSAMATATALKRCPQLVLVPPRFERYREASRAVQRIFADFTDRIEPLSLDEAYLDVTGSAHFQGSATLIAQEIRRRIEAEVGITASAGIAANKLLAKIASDWNKPNGQFVVRPEQVHEFIRDLPVARLWGVGKVTAAKINRMGAMTCADLQTWPLEKLVATFGKFGASLHKQCRGLDERPVERDGRRKSLSVEYTYNQDLPDLAACMEKLPALLEDFGRRFARSGAEEPPHKSFVKIKYHDFTQTTMECVCHQPTAEIFAQLLAQAWPRGGKPVRLLGIGVRYADHPQTGPMSLSLL
ncbi:DNA polymerase-4 [Silvimonas terrae]|uniref:DNA polymerase IV n=1 Tax=Silvimonas terrae TaxID=300266 RepID=A0A840RHW7_9NEIS|nr:DNA polymerase IV [Silvimonas terrae]MBB5192164.1 DNA polymerase-4 [Silvimonas terrae]